MKTSKLSAWLLNGATIVLTIVAVVLGVVRVRESVATADATPEPIPTMVDDWRRYSYGGTRLGPADAQVTIVEFADFSCPFCRQAAGDIREVRRRWPREVAVVYRHLVVHPEARDASLAVECARSAGRFEPMHDALYEHPEAIGVKPWSRWALEAGVRDTVAFAGCMSAPSTDAILVQDSLEARALRARATPTFLINDKMYVGRLGTDRMVRYVEEALRETNRP